MTLSKSFKIGMATWCMLGLMLLQSAAHGQSTPDLLWSAQGHDERVNSVAFSPDGNTLASGGADRLVQLWRVSDGNLVATLNSGTEKTAFNAVYAVAFSPDGQLLAGGTQNRVWVWRVSDGVLLHTLTGHTDAVTALAFSPDGSALATGSYDTTIKLWRVADFALVNTFTGSAGEIRSIAFNPDGATLASGGGDAVVRIWRVSDGRILHNLGGHNSEVMRVTYSPDGSTLASSSTDYTINLYDADSGALKNKLSGHTYFVYDVGFSRDGKLLVSTGGQDNSIRVSRVADGKTVRVFTNETTEVTTLAVGPGGLVAYGRTDGRVLMSRMLTETNRVGLFVSMLPADSGQITLNPPMPPEGYPTGTVVSVSATPGTQDNPFAVWRGDVSGTRNPIQIPMNDHKVLTAFYGTNSELYRFTLTSLVSPPGSGRVEILPLPNAPFNTYTQGTKVTVIAIPNGGNRFRSWVGADKSNAVVSTVTISEDMVVIANFRGGGPQTTGVLVTHAVEGGVVSPVLTGKELKLNKVYSFAAAPRPGYFFTGWSGATNTQSRQVKMLLSGNDLLVANFIPNPFIAARGLYSGLLFDTNAPAFATSGNFTLSVTDRGVYSGKVLLGGKSYPISGSFDSTGQSPLTLRQGTQVRTGLLQIDLTNGTESVIGTLALDEANPTLLGDRQASFKGTNFNVQAGSYTLDFGSSSAVAGHGYGTVKVDAAGRLALRGVLADGTAIAQNSLLTRHGDWPLFLPLYRNKGAAIGWIQFSNGPTSSLSGNVNWFKPADAKAKLYPEGFSTSVPLQGSLFITPAGKNPLVFWTNGVVNLTGGNLETDLTFPVTLSGGTGFAVANTNVTNGFMASLDRAGLLRGSLRHPVTNKTTPLAGVLQMKSQRISGFFTGTNASGALSLVQDPDSIINAVTPLGSLNGETLTLNFVAPKTGLFARSQEVHLDFGTTDFNGNTSGWTSGRYNYSGGVPGSLSELNLIDTRLGGKAVLVRVLLRYTSEKAGTFLATVAAGSTGTAEGTFTLNP